MDRVLGKYSDQAYALMRIVVGFLFLCHGAQKLFGLLGGVDGNGNHVESYVSLYGLGGVIEFFGGLAIMIGLFSGIAAFLSSGMMAVGYFMFHFPNGFWPIGNRGELAVVYCFLFLYIATRGPGIWSVRGGKS